MNSLICSVVTCVYNTNNLCSRESIKVVGKNTITSNFTACESFRRKTGELTSNFKSPKIEVNILCDALNCQYNNNEKCEAISVAVGGYYALSETQTECETFRSKIDK